MQEAPGRGLPFCKLTNVKKQTSEKEQDSQAPTIQLHRIGPENPEAGAIKNWDLTQKMFKEPFKVLNIAKNECSDCNLQKKKSAFLGT